MIENIEQLKSERPDLVELFENMSKEDLLKQCYLECIDAINMEKRVSVFMELCTNNMSKTTYNESSIRSLVSIKANQDVTDFCDYLIEDCENDQEIANNIWELSSKDKKEHLKKLNIVSSENNR